MIHSNDSESARKSLDNDNDDTDMSANELFDTLIDDTGGFGRFQIMMWTISLLASLVTACNHFSPIYLAFTPNYKCVDMRLVQLNITASEDQCTFPLNGNKFLAILGFFFILKTFQGTTSNVKHSNTKRFRLKRRL